MNSYTGEGSYGKVGLFINVRNNEMVAIKCFEKKRLNKPKRLGSKDTFMSDVKREIAILKRIDHNNVLRLIEVIDSSINDKLYIVTEFMHGGVVYKEGKPPLELDRCRRYFRDVLSGLEYLHTNNVRW